MIRTIRAKYCDGKLELLEDLDLEDGEEVVLTVGERSSWPPERPSDELMAADKAWRENHDHEAFKRMIYLARIEGSRERPNL